jgi:ElaB/YqjD/DUF883 family membrane-anchored ribosome-binding protein
MNISGAKDSLQGLKDTGSQILDDVNETGQRLGKMANEAVRTTKRNLHRLQDTAEDAIDETKHVIRRRPVESVALAVGVGVGVGFLLGWIAGSRRRE